MGETIQKEGLRRNQRGVGTAAEQLAAEYLENRGMKITERNFRCRSGEVDLIGHDGGYLVFVEVKYRSGSGKGAAPEAVGIAKQRQICRVADYYRMKHRVPGSTPVRYDVVAIDGGEITWFRNAFAHQYRI